MKGLYVDNWRVGFRTQEECDQLLADCKYMGITDLFIRKQDDISTHKITFDYVEYLTKLKGDMKVHLWLSVLLLGKNNLWTDSTYDADMVVKNPQIVCLDYTTQKAKDYIVNMVSLLVAKYPAIDGIHLDRTRLPNKVETNFTEVNTLIKLVRKACQGKHLSMLILRDEDNWKELMATDVDEVIYFVLANNSKELEVLVADIPKETNSVCLSVFQSPLELNQQAITSLAGKNIYYFSYASNGFSTTKQQFLDMVKNDNNNS